MRDARFTPARAGNTKTCWTSGKRSPVHPCAGREHLGIVGSANFYLRFTPARAGNTQLGLLLGFVGSVHPARAGNTSQRLTIHASTTVHPCAGREHPRYVFDSFRWYGSPLRGQGTLETILRRARELRFTPARAGNTLVTCPSVPMVSVHPCAGREHRNNRRNTMNANGSPLRGQGTLADVLAGVGDVRFTPARAGNTRLERQSCC